MLADPTADAHEWDGGEGEASAMSMKPVGPIADRFVKDRAFIDIIMGPYGSAKTTSCFQRIIWIAMWQNPGPDGVRRSRGAVVRATYDQLKSNVMDDFFAWFPKTKDNFNGEDMISKINLDIPGFGKVYIEILWRALGEEKKPEKLFKGMQLTWLWLNEADTLMESVLTFGMPRVGRYPKAKDGGCAWSGVFMDLNAPDVDNWVYRLAVDQDDGFTEKQREDLRKAIGPEFRIAFHEQPGGLDPNAENKANLPPGYYERMMLKMSENDIRRFVHNKFGAVRGGQPVYPEFNDRHHVSETDIGFTPGIALSIAADGGGTPAAVIGQKMPDGQLRVIDEVVIMSPDQDKGEMLARIGPTAFGREVRAVLNERYPDATVGAVWSDPAAGYGGDDDDLAWRDAFAKALKLPVKDAPVRGNRITIRLEAVREKLTQNLGAKPWMVISPRCRFLRRGFNNGYVIDTVRRSSGEHVLKDVPGKGPFSHVHDALQYLVCGTDKRGAILDRIDADHRQRQRGKIKYGGYAGAK